MSITNGLPKQQGLYNPQHEHDACGFGFICNIKGVPSNEIVSQGIEILKNLDHRGGVGDEVNSGDGAGVMLQIPHDFFIGELKKQNIDLPEHQNYGVGQIFLPPHDVDRKEIKRLFEQTLRQHNQRFLAWREVPTDNSSLGKSPLSTEPKLEQIFIAKDPSLTNIQFERKLYIIRKSIEHQIKGSSINNKNFFYIPSLSSRKIVYKGQLATFQILKYFSELNDPLFKSCFAMVHSRFSTNTFPTWGLAQPFRYISHNGEINTLRGNINWMKARYKHFVSDVFSKEELQTLLPIIDEEGSDSAILDNAIELLSLSGRSLPHTMMMLIPEAWEKQKGMSENKKAFYQYHSLFMEPWDGPAAISFTDGHVIGGILDRNGLRPSRYTVLKKDIVIMASEAGVLESVKPEDIISQERLSPGKILLIDFDQGKLISDEEIKNKISNEHPYQDWLKNNHHLSDLAVENKEEQNKKERLSLSYSLDDLSTRQKIFGYTQEDLRVLMSPMMNDGKEPIGSMGTDTPLAILSQKAQVLNDYFHQLFAQVTNPPIDPIREEALMSLITFLGKQKNTLSVNKGNIDKDNHSLHTIELNTPVLSPENFQRLFDFEKHKLKSKTFSISYDFSKHSLENFLSSLHKEIEEAILNEGVVLIILDDSTADKTHLPVPSLLAISSLHYYLIDKGLRFDCSLIIKTGEVREVHHFATLFGYGANAIYPYLAFASIETMQKQKLLSTDKDNDYFVNNFIDAVDKGILKIMSKMGISTLRSYTGAQIFEIIGLGEDLVDKYFTGTASRLGGINIDGLEKEAKQKHSNAFKTSPSEKFLDVKDLDEGGKYSWRQMGEKHLFNPTTIHTLQQACKKGDYALYQKYAEFINKQTEQIYTIRGLLNFKENPSRSIPIEKVESIESIMKRFVTGAMSYGSISWEAHTTLAIAMNRIKGKSNTGEGGEDPIRYQPLENGDSMRSAIKQVASGRFGVTSSYLVNADELQIKIAQGAKPGEGGQLPGHKVDDVIGKVRHSTPGVGLISPPPHHDIYSIEDLAQLIYDLKNSNDKARVSVKLVSEAGVGTIAAGVTKANADCVIIAGFDGGTGASPLTSIKHAGIPWELGVAETHQTLINNNLRTRVALQTDGQIKTGKDVAIATLLGAEEWGVATAALVVEGCIMMRKCHLNTCPVGIATQDPDLRALFTGSADDVVNLFRFLATEMREIMAKLGFRSVNEMVGQTDHLQVREDKSHWKIQSLNLDKLLYSPSKNSPPNNTNEQHCCISQLDNLKNVVDRQWLKENMDKIQKRDKVVIKDKLINIQRTVGTLLSAEITRLNGKELLLEDSVKLELEGNAGQSFAAFATKGMTFEIEGLANDYFGKGLSGAKVILYPQKKSSFKRSKNVIVGNVAFYGATSGEAYINGMGGERFCVRNSGVEVVINSIGIHGCEYMTGGKVIVLGSIGRNFAAGMSGGIAYLYDKDAQAKDNINMEMVGIETPTIEDLKYIQDKVTSFRDYTKCENAKDILVDWDNQNQHFIKIMPHDYKRVLEQRKKVAV